MRLITLEKSLCQDHHAHQYYVEEGIEMKVISYELTYEAPVDPRLGRGSAVLVWRNLTFAGAGLIARKISLS
jgi:hypothetical protein